MRRRFDTLFVTFDLDGEASVQKTLDSLGMRRGIDFLPIGVKKPGAECIEGLVPERVKSAVYGSAVELVEKLGSADAPESKSARNSLKKKLLEAMKGEQLSDADLAEFAKLFQQIAKALK